MTRQLAESSPEPSPRVYWTAAGCPQQGTAWYMAAIDSR
jgi:hypothetical protein